MALAMISLLKKALCPVVVGFGFTSACLAQSTFFEVASTPYDHQMQPVQSTLNTPPVHATYGPSLDLVNGWMTALRSMPYQYSRQWRTPFEVEMAKVGDCKGKALLLYGWMRSSGANNVRLVIGKRRTEDLRTHAWLEWDTTIGTFLLDPTFNWSAASRMQDSRTYVPFYGYGDGHKYRVANSLLANRNFANHNPAAPAHGVIARPVPTNPRPYSNYRPVYQTTSDPRSFSNSRPSFASLSMQRDVHDFSGRVYPQGKPISNAVRNNQLARAAFIEPGPIAKQRRTESGLLVQHQLPAVSVTRKNQRHSGVRRGVESMRVMREQNRERIGVSSLE
jgi:hypothetical protein